MKIAICISGQFRPFKFATDLFLKQLPSGHQFDYYVHTWKTNAPTERDLKLDYEVTEDLVRKFYSPLKIVIEDQKTFDASSLDSETIPPQKTQTVMSMYYSIKQSIELTRDENYDAVIRYRSDSLLMDPIFIPQDLDTLWVIGDCFAISSQENMVSYSKTYDNFKRLFRRCEYEIGFPEAFVHENARLYCMPYSPLKIKHDIGRNDLDCLNKIGEYNANNRS